VKAVNTINNDCLSKDLIDLFIREKSRKHSVSENLYLTNFFNLCDSSTIHHHSAANSSSYRILYSPELRVMTIHQFDLTNGGSSNRDSENFKDFIEVNIFKYIIKPTFLLECLT
jgi:hypothetical protein